MIIASFLALAAIAAPIAQKRPDIADKARDAEWRTRPDPLSVQMVLNFAKCAAKRTPAGAEALLAMDFRTPEYGAALRQYVRGHNYCGPNTKLKFNGLLFAGGLAETLLDKTPNVAARLAPVSGAAPAVARTELEAVGLCLSRRAPNEVVALLATDPTSEAERVALSAITPQLSGCLAKGQQARFNRPGLRALIATAAYRLVNLPTGA